MSTKTKSKIKLIFLWIAAIAVSIVAIFVYFNLERKNTEQFVEISEENLDDGEETAKLDEGYASETSYSGSSYVPASLFKYPFKKSDSYIQNKDYINLIGAENATITAERTAEGLEKIFNINYEALEESDYEQIIDEYVNSDITIVFPDGTVTEGADELQEKIFELVKEDEIIIESKAYSDSCMVYYDNSFEICRVKLTMVLYSCNDLERAAEIFGVENITLGEAFSVIYDVYTGTNIVMGDRSSFVFYSASKVN